MEFIQILLHIETNPKRDAGDNKTMNFGGGEGQLFSLAPSTAELDFTETASILHIYIGDKFVAVL